MRCELQRNLILVEVVLVVGTEAYEYRKLSVFKICHVLLERVGMHEHLQSLVLTHVDRRVLIHSLRLARSEIVDCHRQCLLIALYKLRLRGVLLARYARRQNVVDRCLVVVLLDVDGTHLKTSGRSRRVVEVLLVDTPLASNKVERTEAQHDGVLESGEEHTHETYRCEVGDAPHPTLVLT